MAAGLWMNDPATPEGKYPVVLRRDGTALEAPYFVLVARDPCFEAAMRAYADEAERRGFDPQYVADVRAFADQAEGIRQQYGEGDPDAPRHREDDPLILEWARSIRSKSA